MMHDQGTNSQSKHWSSVEQNCIIISLPYATHSRVRVADRHVMLGRNRAVYGRTYPLFRTSRLRSDRLSSRHRDMQTDEVNIIEGSPPQSTTSSAALVPRGIITINKNALRKINMFFLRHTNDGHELILLKRWAA